MKVSVEISYYPLNQNFKTPIVEFIQRLHTYEGLTVITNNMSTQIFGDYEVVMHALTSEIRQAFTLPHSVFVMKIINSDLRPEQ